MKRIPFIILFLVVAIQAIAQTLSANETSCNDVELRALVSRDNKVGYVNAKGVEVIPLTYDQGTNFYNGYACVRRGKRSFIIDCNGNTVSEVTNVLERPSDYSWAEHERYNPITGFVYFINYNNNTILTWNSDGSVIRTRWNLPSDVCGKGLISEGIMQCEIRSLVRRTTKSNRGSKMRDDDDVYKYSIELYKSDGQRLYSKSFTDVHPPFCGMSRFTKYRKRTQSKVDTTYIVNYGFVDTLGREIPNCAYDFAYDFSDGLACVHKGGKAGYIDTKGNVVIPFKFDGEKQRTTTKFHKEHPYVNLWNGKYEVYGSFHNGMALQKLNDEIVVTNKSGDIINTLDKFRGCDVYVEHFNNGVIVIMGRAERRTSRASSNGNFSYWAYSLKDGIIVPFERGYGYMGPFVSINDYK